MQNYWRLSKFCLFVLKWPPCPFSRTARFFRMTKGKVVLTTQIGSPYTTARLRVVLTTLGQYNFLPNTLRWSLPCVMVWGLPLWFQNCYCFHFRTLQNYVCKCWTPLKSQGSPIMVIYFNVWMLIWKAQKKGPGALNATQKETSALCKIPFPNNSRKPVQNVNFWQNITTQIWGPFRSQHEMLSF